MIATISENLSLCITIFLSFIIRRIMTDSNLIRKLAVFFNGKLFLIFDLGFRKSRHDWCCLFWPAFNSISRLSFNGNLESSKCFLFHELFLKIRRFKFNHGVGSQIIVQSHWFKRFFSKIVLWIMMLNM